MHKNPSPMGHEIYKFGRPFIRNYYYILTLFDPCPSVDRKRIRNIVFSLYGHDPAQEPYPVGHKIYNFGILFLGHHYFILRLPDICLGVEKKIKKQCIFTLCLK